MIVSLSSFGPLPCIEVINLNIPLQEIPSKSLPKNFKELGACCNFFSSLGYPYPHNLGPIYSDNNWRKFYEIHRDEVFYKNHTAIRY